MSRDEFFKFAWKLTLSQLWLIAFVFCERPALLGLCLFHGVLWIVLAAGHVISPEKTRCPNENRPRTS